MPKPLSLDMRKRIIDSTLRGDAENGIAREKDVSKSTVTKLWVLYKEMVSYEPRPKSTNWFSLMKAAQIQG